MHRSRITPADFPPTVGAFSLGYTVDSGDTRFIFVSGQIALDEKGELVSEDVGDQTRYAFERISRILREAGSSLDDVVKSQIFVTDISYLPTVSPIRNEYFAKSKPANTLVAVNALAHPGCKVEIEAIAAVSSPKA